MLGSMRWRRRLVPRLLLDGSVGACDFAGYIAFGIALWMGLQSFVSIGVNLGLLPTKGLTLPLLSYGGSALLANCSALAILLRIDWENRQTLRGYKV